MLNFGAGIRSVTCIFLFLAIYTVVTVLLSGIGHMGDADHGEMEGGVAGMLFFSILFLAQ